MTLRVVSAPVEDPVGADIVRTQARVAIADDEPRLRRHIREATQMAEQATQRRLVTQTLEWSLPRWRCPLRLPVAPVATDGVVKVEYTGEDGVRRILAANQYVVRPSGPTVDIVPARNVLWPLLDAYAAEQVVVTFVAGTAAALVSELIAGVIAAAAIQLFDEAKSYDEVRAWVSSALIGERWT